MEKVVILGTGPMALDYAKVLTANKVSFMAVGRGQEKCDKFKAETGAETVAGGFEKWIAGLTSLPKKVIVAVSEESLGQAAAALMERNVESILIEKPGAATYEELEKLANLAKKSKSKVFVGYNRRFYDSVQMAKKLIAEDGGVQSFFFEFTEWGHVIRNKVCPDLVKEEWLWHNSTHVMDMAFYLGGFPKKMNSFVQGSLDWHKRGAKYSGAGVTNEGATFSYMANWAAPGRWVVEILTSQRRFIFKPLEKLQIQKIGSVAVEEYALDNPQDLNFKPGLHNQVQSFLVGSAASDALVTIDQQLQNLKYYRQIETGNE